MTSLTTPLVLLFTTVALLMGILVIQLQFPVKEAFQGCNYDADLRSLETKYKTLLNKQTALYDTLLENYNKMITNLNNSADSAQQAAQHQTELASTLKSL